MKMNNSLIPLDEVGGWIQEKKYKEWMYERESDDTRCASCDSFRSKWLA